MSAAACRLFLLALCLTLAALPSSRGDIVISTGKPVTASGPLWSGFPVGNVVDGSPSTFTHPVATTGTTGFKYEVNLLKSYALSRIRIYNRDNCCPERLTNYRVSVHPDNGAGAPGPAVWTANVRTNGTNSGMGGVDELTAAAHAAGTFTGQWVRLENLSGNAYNPQVAELEIRSDDFSTTPNLALGKTVTSSAATYAGLPAGNLTDGSPTTISHPQAATGTTGFYYQIDLSSTYPLDRIVLFSRADGCCPERLTNFRLSVLEDAGGTPGAVAWSADLRTDGSFPAAGGVDTVSADAGTGTFTGRFVRLTNLSGEAYNPQLAEIEVYRAPVPQIRLFQTDAGNITATGNPALPAQATLSWNVEGATSLSVDQGIGDVPGPTGSRVVAPAVATVYTLTATNASGSATATVTIAVDATQQPPQLTEFMADNGGSIEDADGDRPDWIEVHNPNPFSLNLAGYHLTDDPAAPGKWTFPATSVPPDGYVIVFASGKDRAEPGSELHANFSLSKGGEYLALTGTDASTVLTQYPLDHPTTPAFPEQTSDTSYGLDATGQPRFFRPATPGEPNAATGYLGVVADTIFAPGRGLYDTPQPVTISTTTAGATIRYTTNGSLPTESTGTVYTGPITVSANTVIRAAAFAPDFAPTNVDTHTYVFPATVASQSVMSSSITGNATYGPQLPAAFRDLPSVSLVTPTPAAFNDNTDVATNFEFLHPTLPTASFHAAGGLHYFGGAFTNFAKKSFRVKFSSATGDRKLEGNLFEGHEHGRPVTRKFDSIELRNGSHDMVDRGFYMANLFTDEVMAEMGHISPHGRMVHVYINGTYWGVYHLRERWGAAMHADYLGGPKDGYESINGNYNVGGWADPASPYDGDGSVWQTVKTRRPAFTNLRSMVDVPNLVDFMIMWMFGNSEDEWRCTGPAVTTEGTSGFRFMLNDADGWLSIGSGNTVAVWDGNDNNTARSSSINGANFSPGRSAGDGPAALFGGMFVQADPEFRLLVADRIHRHLVAPGALTPTRNAARLNALCTPIERAFIAEAARWNYRSPASWTAARNACLTQWIPNRTNTVLTQFRNAQLYPTLAAPVYSQQGGVFTGSLALTVSAAAGTVHVTTDGSDPRLPGGAVSPTAQTPAGPLTLARNTIVKARVRNGTTWSALNEAFFWLDATGPVPAGSVVPSEIHFNPDGDDGHEFIELMNVSDAAVNLRGCTFSDGFEYFFNEWQDTLLAPGQRIVLVGSEWHHRARYGWDRPLAGIFRGGLNNGGERIALECGGTTVFDVETRGKWHRLADGNGHSLTLRKPAAGVDLNDPENWRPSTLVDGSPGAADPGVPFAGNPDSDAEGDGLNALLEYALGTSDAAFDPSPLVPVFGLGTLPEFEFTRAAAADDATLVAEVSDDLGTWHSGEDYLVPVSEEKLPDGRLRVRMTTGPQFSSATGRAFIRLRAALR